MCNYLSHNFISVVRLLPQLRKVKHTAVMYLFLEYCRQNKIEKRPKFKSYFICKMALKPPKVETGILGFEYFAAQIAGN